MYVYVYVCNTHCVCLCINIFSYQDDVCLPSSAPHSKQSDSINCEISGDPISPFYNACSCQFAGRAVQTITLIGNWMVRLVTCEIHPEKGGPGLFSAILWANHGFLTKWKQSSNMLLLAWLISSTRWDPRHEREMGTSLLRHKHNIIIIYYYIIWMYRD